MRRLRAHRKGGRRSVNRAASGDSWLRDFLGASAECVIDGAGLLDDVRDNVHVVGKEEARRLAEPAAPGEQETQRVADIRARGHDGASGARASASTASARL